MDATRTSASLGRRTGAGVLDALLAIPLFLAWSAISGGLDSSHGVNAHVENFALLGYLATYLAYFFVFEATLGATPGKLVVGLRVVRAGDGGRPSAGPLAGRTLLRLIDGLPVLYFVAFVCVAVTPTNQRIGDLAAGTLVVDA